MLRTILPFINLLKKTNITVVALSSDNQSYSGANWICRGDNC